MAYRWQVDPNSKPTHRELAAYLAAITESSGSRALRKDRCSLVDAHGPKHAARVFAKVLSGLESHGERAVIAAVERSLTSGEPVLLCLPPKTSAPLLARDALPASLQGIEVAPASAADFDALLRGAP